MEDKDFASLIIGKWQGEALETEMGTVRNVLTFQEDKYFRLEAFWGTSPDPMVTLGLYEVQNDHLVTEQLNKGEPILMEFQQDGQELILHMPDEEPMQFLRQ